MSSEKSSELASQSACKQLSELAVSNRDRDVRSRNDRSYSKVCAKTGPTGSRFSKFVDIPKEDLNSFGMIAYHFNGQVRTPLPPNLAPHVMSPTPAVALDCEFVDIGDDDVQKFTLARAAVVNEYGHQLYHTFVKPKSDIKDYLTEISGVRKEDIQNGISLEEFHQEIHPILKGRLLVGHSIDDDLNIAQIQHTKSRLRDTAIFFKGIYKKTPSLKLLIKNELGIYIQEGQHSPIEDAQAAMKLYLRYRSTWEKLRSKKQYYLTPGMRLLPAFFPF